MAAPVAAQDVDLSFEDARILGRQAVTTGNSELALQISASLLEADPEDADAWLIRAAALLQSGDATAARQAAANAYRFAPTDPRRYEAARIAALSAANEDRLTLSQLWLRRALTVSPNDTATQQTLRDAAQVRRQNPLSLDVNFGLYPSDNANGGTTAEVISVNGDPIIAPDLNFGGGTLEGGVRTIAGSDRALPGIRGNLGLSGTYRLSESETQRTSVSASIDARYVWLFEEAQTIAPGVRNSEFASTTLTFGVEHLRAAEAGTWTYAGEFGEFVDAGDLATRFANMSVSRGLAVSDTLFLRGSFDVQRNLAVDPRADDSTRAGLRGLALLGVGDGDRVSLSFGLSKVFTPALSGDSDTVYAQIGYIPNEMVGPARVQVSAGVVYTDWSDYAFLNGFANDPNALVTIPGGRQDTRLFSSLTASFPDQSYAGFTPVVTINVSDTTSDFDQFEGTSVSVGFNVESQF